MKFRSIKTKLAVATGLCFFVIVSTLITSSSITIRNHVVADAKAKSMKTAQKVSSRIESEIELALDTARTLAHTLSAVKDQNSPLDIDRDQINSILSTVLNENASFLGTYTLWEPNAFDQKDFAYANLPGHDHTGRLIPYWSRGPNGLTLAPLVNYETVGAGDYYQIPKRLKSEALIEPYLYPVQGEDVYITSLVVPIVRDGKFYGIAGVDIRLSAIQKIVETVGLFEGQKRLCVFSHEGKIVAASHNAELQGKNIAFVHKDWKDHLGYIKGGASTFEEDEGGFVALTPINIGETQTPWAVNLDIPRAAITAGASHQMWFSILVGFTICGFSLAIVYKLIERIVAPLTGITEIAERVAQGDLDWKEVETSNDEIGRVNMAFGEVAHSLRVITNICEAVALGDFSQSTQIRSDNDVLCQSINQMGETLRAVVNQANAISQGDYSLEITPRSEADELGIALANMTQQLRDTIRENERENWFKTGQSALHDKMRGEQSVVDLAQNIVTQLASTVDAQIGAVFLAEQDKTLKLVSSYAYTRRKGMANEFKPGQGLVGQALMEKKAIIMTDVPDDYIAVQSGVGQAVPRSILVLPFLQDQEVIGVLELGSFNEFTPLQMEFLEKVSENIAISINAAQSRSRMSELLEETQSQSEALQNQQEELRATNEELEEQTQQLKSSEELLKSQQEQLESSNAQLEAKTEKLEEQKQDIETSWKQIQAKSEQLERANEYKSEFLSNMSHELRTPLNSLLILAKILTENGDGNLTEEQVKSSKMIYEGGQELLSLINEILDLAKIEAGKMEFNFEKVQLSQLAQSLESEFTPLAGKKSLDFKVDVEKDASACIRTDKKRTKQILKNLLSNAFKFTAKGQITVRISRPAENVDLSASQLDHANAIAFAVSDTGIGIAEAKQQMIFTAFQQADGNIDRQFGGTGLGLSISMHLAKLLGGEIQLRSEEGQGSTFTLYLPKTLDAACESQDNAEPSVASEDVSPPKIDRTVTREKVRCTATQVIADDRGDISPDDKVILIIEDDPKFSGILQSISHEKGFKCLAEDNGEAGLISAAENQPQAIILDVGLPGIDGFKVINGLKENSATRHIPVHFISGQDETQCSAKALSMGAIGYLTKPASKEQLDQVFSDIQAFISTDIKRLLVAEDDANTRESIVKLIGSRDVDIAAVGTGHEAHELLKRERFDCMVLDLGLPDISGFSLLEQIEHDDEIIAKPPIVIYSGKDLTRAEAMKLRKHSGSIILKGAESPERLLDETSLFLHQIETALPQEQQRMIRMAHERETVLRGKKVLIVDDDMRNIFALSHALKAKEMIVIRAETGQEALEMLDAHPDVDIVLMDIMMPVMDGYEAMRKIREQEKYWKLPILALTAKAMKDDRKKCIEAGANDYLAKPVDLDKVMSMLRVWLYI